jgi:hypothetical protein
MMGPPEVNGTINEERGMIPRAFEHIFQVKTTLETSEDFFTVFKYLFLHDIDELTIEFKKITLYDLLHSFRVYFYFQVDRDNHDFQISGQSFVFGNLQ